MKIRIKKFCNLQDVAVETPAQLIGSQGVGKSTILRAVYYALNCSDPKTNKRFDERIYSESARSKGEDDFAEVSLIFDNKKLTRRSVPKTSRVKGSEEVAVIYNVESRYYVNDVQITLSEYESVISEHFKGFKPEIFLSTSGFLNSTKDEKRAIFEKIIGDRKDFSDEKNSKKSKINEIKKDITIKQSVIADRKADLLIEVSNPSVNILLTENDVRELQREKQSILEQIAKNAPKLTDLQISENSEIRKQIGELERAVFSSNFVDTSNEIFEKFLLIRTELKVRKQQLEELEVVNEIINTEDFDVKIKQVEDLQNLYDNYEKIKENSLCKKCVVCTLTNCKHRDNDLPAIEEVENQLNEMLLHDFQQQKTDYILLKEKEIKEQKEKRINAEKRLQDAISELQSELDKNEIEFNKRKELAKIEQEKHKEKKTKFEAEKQAKIKELQAKLHVLEEPDNEIEKLKISEIEKLIKDKEFDLLNLRKEKSKFDEIQGIKENAEKRIIELNEQLNAMQQSLINAEKELISVESQEVEYFKALEGRIYSLLPEGVNVSLFKNNKSNEGFKFDFELNFNEKLDFSTSEEMEQFIPFLQWLHKQLNIIDIPILVDEFAVFTGNIEDLGNSIICVADKNVKELTINN